jgi:uncharacterized protein involved in outer membrane biogenesis
MHGKSIARTLFLVAGLLIVLLVIVASVFWLHLNAIARVSIEKVLSHVLLVNVSVESVRISPLSGKAALHRLVIGNPEGYKTPEAFSVDTVAVVADIRSFRTSQPTIKSITLHNPRITLEQGFSESNISRLIRNASRLKSQTAERKAPPAARKQIRIQTLTIDGAAVALSAPVLQGREITVPMPAIELHNIGDEQNRVTIATAVQVVLVTILSSAIDAGGTLIPPDLQKALKKSLHSLVEGMGDAAKHVIQQTGKLGEQLKEGGKAVRKEVKGLDRGIRELFKRKD